METVMGTGVKRTGSPPGGDRPAAVAATARRRPAARRPFNRPPLRIRAFLRADRPPRLPVIGCRLLNFNQVVFAVRSFQLLW
jgi:hypothetical protein